VNTFQIAYTLWLAGLFAFRGPSRAVWILLANLVATLLACLLLDLGHMDRMGLTVSLMVIDLAAASRAQALIRITQPADPSIIAAVFGDDADAALAVLGVTNG